MPHLASIGLMFRVRLHDTDTTRSTSRPLYFRDVSSPEHNPFVEQEVLDLFDGVASGTVVACMLW